MSGYNDEWQNSWISPTQELEGWGMRAYKFAGGTGAPLNLMVQPTQFGVTGSILAKDASTGTWSMTSLRIDSQSGAGTGLVHGFGNTTDEVWVIAWYESQVSDCDYNFASCGITTGSYPSTDITVQAGIITDPAEIDIISMTAFDRDLDNVDDSVEIDIEVISNAFFEIIEVTFEAFLNNTLRDTITFAVTAGNSIPTEDSVWFTPPESGDWTFEYMRNKDYKPGLEIFKNTKNVFILRTFSKIYGLASLRIGWGYGDKKIISELYKIKPPFNVNKIAQACANEALKDNKFLIKSVKHNILWCKKVKKELEKYKISTNNIGPNFFLLNFNKCKFSADKVEQKLEDSGIILRESSIKELEKRYI